MYALTLWPEWAHAIVHFGKRVENRGWFPPDFVIGDRIAIHAGKYLGGRPGRVARAEAIEAVERMAHLAGVGEVPDAWWDDVVCGAIVCTVRLVGAHVEHRTGWDVPDAVHWRLDDVRPLAVPHRTPGAQGLWPVFPLPDELRALEVAGG